MTLSATLFGPSLERMLCLDDFEGTARAVLPRPLFEYIVGGAETNMARDDNRHALSEFAFITRALRNTADRSQGVALFGEEYASPFGIAPMGLCALSSYRGDLSLAAAAAEARIPAILSGASLTPLETLSRHAPGTWFQMYIPAQRDQATAILKRIEAANYRTLVITVDVPVPGNRENNVRAGFATPLRPSLRLAADALCRPRWTIGTLLRTVWNDGMPHFENGSAERGTPVFSATAGNVWAGRDHLDIDDLKAIRDQWRGHLVVKGLLSVEDVQTVRSCGADGVILSDHGGRQLDSAVSAQRMLPLVTEAVGSDFPILIDGGFRRGSDVLKALALGARMVLIGRPFNFACAVGGKAGVDRAISLLRAEIDRNLSMLGCRSLSELNTEALHRQSAPVRH